MSEKTWFTPRELAERWVVNIRAVSRRINSGDIRSMKLGEAVRVHISEVKRIEATSVVNVPEDEAKPTRHAFRSLNPRVRC